MGDKTFHTHRLPASGWLDSCSAGSSAAAKSSPGRRLQVESLASGPAQGGEKELFRRFNPLQGVPRRSPTYYSPLDSSPWRIRPKRPPSTGSIPSWPTVIFLPAMLSIACSRIPPQPLLPRNPYNSAPRSPPSPRPRTCNYVEDLGGIGHRGSEGADAVEGGGVGDQPEPGDPGGAAGAARKAGSAWAARSHWISA